MTNLTRRRLVLSTLALSIVRGGVFRPAHADTYPSRPVHLLVGGAAGSVPDTVARLIGERLAAALGHPVIVENRPLRMIILFLAAQRWIISGMRLTSGIK